MSYRQLYDHAASLAEAPITIERDLVPVVKQLTSQDFVYFIPVELDTQISLGHIKQYRESRSVYDADPLWITDIRYHHELNICWQRYVCCKELMHVFDTMDERTDSAVKWERLLDELESPPPPENTSEMFYSENRTKWKALGVLCPLPMRDRIIALRAAGELTDDYDVALALRLPEDTIATIMSETFPGVIRFLTGQE